MRVFNKSLVVLGLLILFLLIYFVSSFGEGIEEVRIVTKVIDGDTVIVQGGESVRLLGIDCDERGKKCYGAAKDYVEGKIYEKEVKLERSVEDEDIYGRKLRYIFIDGENLNEELVAKGYCSARFEEEIEYKEEIILAEEKAIKGGIGCKWS